MSRRCTSERCLMRTAKVGRHIGYGLPVTNILHDPKREWGLISRTNKRIASHKVSVDWDNFDVKRYLLTHCSIVVSCNLEDNGYYIKPSCSKLVNNNGNAWSDEILLATFRTFVGAHNFYEHVQDEEKSKGTIVDAVIRPIEFKDPDTNEIANVWLVDILVATERKHEELVHRIEDGDLTTMSMGAIVKYVTCSKCGKIFGDEDKPCIHIQKELLTYFIDENGVKRIVSELCGRHIKRNGKWVADPESQFFIEASWVEKPAYKGAVLNHYVSEIGEEAKTAFDMRSAKFEFDLNSLRVADRDGAMALRIAREVVNKRKRDDLVSRVAQSYKFKKQNGSSILTPF